MFSHPSVVKVFAHTNHLSGRLAEMKDSDPKVRPSHITIDGIPVEKELYDFATEVRKAFRDCKFGIIDKPAREVHYKNVWSEVNGEHIMLSTMYVNQLAVYYPNSRFVMGVIGYGGFYNSSSNSDKVYRVQSRNITNERYNMESDNYNAVLSKNLATAVKAAKKHMRDFTTAEVAKAYVEDFITEVNRERWQISNVVGEQRRSIAESPEVIAEFAYLLKSGHVFRSESLREKISSLLEATDALGEFNSTTVPAVFVAVSDYLGEQVFDLIDMPNCRQVNSTMPIDSQSVRRLKQEDMSEEVLGKIAVLSMMDDGHYISGVGKRMNATTYWIMLEPQNGQASK